MARKQKFRVIFLGERKISWEALKILRSEKYSNFFDIRVIVTDDQTFQRYKSDYKTSPDVYIENRSRNSEQILSAIASKEIDLLISVQHNWILPPDILNSVNRLAFNLHNAKLPDYKGYNSVSHAILNGDSTYESTIHWMDDDVDCGDIAYVGYTKIRSEDTARSLYLRTIDTAVNTFERLLEALVLGEEIPRVPFDRNLGCFYSRNSLNTLSNVTNLTNKEEISKFARALFFPPHNAAYFTAGDSKYFVIPSSECEDLTVFGAPANITASKQGD